MSYFLFCALLMSFLLTGCSNFSVESRQNTAQTLILHKDWEGQVLQTALFPIQAYVPKNMNKTPSNRELTVYIEGDGLSWISRSKASLDPTPITPLGLQLALADNVNTAAYLARPCQYVRNERCEKRYWTYDRFSEKVVASMNEALGQLKQEFGVQKIQLVGYSGGGAIAALLAARRRDVIRLITVAGNLDPVAWTNFQKISPLTGSLNPADSWSLLSHIPQVHFVGGKDKTVPYAVAESYRNRFPVGQKPVIKVIEMADHHCCWVEQWPELINQF